MVWLRTPVHGWRWSDFPGLAAQEKCLQVSLKGLQAVFKNIHWSDSNCLFAALFAFIYNITSDPSTSWCGRWLTSMSCVRDMPPASTSDVSVVCRNVRCKHYIRATGFVDPLCSKTSATCARVSISALSGVFYDSRDVTVHQALFSCVCWGPVMFSAAAWTPFSISHAFKRELTLNLGTLSHAYMMWILHRLCDSISYSAAQGEEDTHTHTHTHTHIHIHTYIPCYCT